MNVKIDLRILPTQGARDALASDSAASSAIDPDQLVFVLDAEGEPFDRYLEATRRTEGSRFFSMLRFDEDELESAALFQPQCRKVARETDRDYRLNNERLKASEPILAGPDFETRLLDRISLGKLDLKPDTIAGVGEWTIEYVAPSAVVEKFRDAELTGLELRPVFNPRTKADHPGFAQLFAKSLMPPLVREGAVRRQTSEKGPEVAFRQLGCLIYPAGTRDRVKDFNRTAEPFTFFGGPDWVVTARVREVYRRNQMKGWDFLPVLQEGEALHRDFTTKWERVRERVGGNPRNVL